MAAEYHLASSKESHGNYGSFGVKIYTTEKDELPAPQRYALYEALDKIEAAYLEHRLANGPVKQKEAQQEREDLLSVFGDTAIYVETIPNGYCSRWCCKHRPWFIVTTPIGRFKIGWRSGVILIDWSETVGAKTTAELFKDEDVTKDERMIHARTLDNARRYVAAVLASAEKR